jgi:hypothetical protein
MVVSRRRLEQLLRKGAKQLESFGRQGCRNPAGGYLKLAAVLGSDIPEIVHQFRSSCRDGSDYPKFFQQSLSAENAQANSVQAEVIKQQYIWR